MSNNVNSPTRVQRRHAATRDEIQKAAWELVDRDGIVALSLRSLAAAVDLSAPALYRYFSSKADLITALIIDAYESLAQAHRVPPSDDWRDDLRRLGRLYRQWAFARPAAFQLLFGSPVPGYEAPLDAVLPAAGRSFDALVAVLSRAHAEGDLALPLEPAPTRELQDSLEAWATAAHPGPADVLYLAFVIASRVQGLVTIELGRQLPPFFANGEALYERELERMISELGPSVPKETK